MQTVDANYTALIAQNHDVECKVDVYSSDGQTLVGSFGEDKIVSMRTSNSLFAGNTVGVGGATSGEIDLSIRDVAVTIPRMAMLKPYIRLSGYVNGTLTVSGWLPKGVYWIDTRSQDYTTEIWSFHGYDAMLKAEQPNTNTSTNSKTLLTNICSVCGFTLENDIDDIDVITISNPKSYTFREILNIIAAYNGGNWTFSSDGKLRLLPLNSLPEETYILIDKQGYRITFGGVGILTEVV